MKTLKEIFSSGGGTQSTAIAALIVQGRLPKPDLVVIADTGRECAETWKYLETTVRPMLMDVGVQIYRIGHEWATTAKNERDWIGHNGNTLKIPAWTTLSGNIGKLPGFCSSNWKVEVIDRFLSRKFGIIRSKYRKWIGFSFDEWRRAQRIMVGKEGKKGLIRLPLIQDIPLNRQQAIQQVKKMGWSMPPRSRCWMCPNQSDDEWRDLKLNYPEEFGKAITFEKEMQLFDLSCWLHKSCIPLSDVDFSEEPTLFDSSQYCSSGVCFV